MSVRFAGRARSLAAGSAQDAPARTGAARQQTLRELNLGLVLGCILDAPGPVSRADLAHQTGMTRGTISALVDLLVAARMVTELDPVVIRKVGRPAVPLVPASGTMVGIGLEVNVDYLGARALDLAGNVIAEEVIEGNYRQTNPQEVLAALAVVAERMAADQLTRGVQVVGTCIALPGLVDRGAGPLRLAPNLGWRETDLVGMLDHGLFAEFGVRLGNEANLAARAEGRALADDDPSFLYVSGEVGIGGAFVHEGSVFVGDHGWSGELGHTTIDPFGPRCSCGALGCLEQYAGKDAMMSAAGLHLDLPVTDLVAALEAGSTRARAAVARAGWALGVAFSNFMNLTDINRVILGGIYTPLEPYLRTPIEQELHSRVLSAPWSAIDVRPAVGGSQAAMTGAALAVLGMVVRDPSAWGATKPTEKSASGPGAASKGASP